MVPEEIYVGGTSSAKFQYSHPLSHLPVDDGSLRARLAYDLMEFMGREDCRYYARPDASHTYDPHELTDEIDIMIVDGNYKEAGMMIDSRLREDPHDEKLRFQKSFLLYLKQEYEKLLAKEDRALKNDPGNVNALINKGFALANLDREEEALKVSDQALRIEPDNILALSNKAYIAKSLGKDDVRDKTLAHAYNVSAKNRIRELQKLESKLLRDFESVFVEIDTPSAFEEFNLRSGASKMVH